MYQSDERSFQNGAREKLLGKIYALMAILNSTNDEENQISIFNFKPHPAQISALLLLLNITEKDRFGNLHNALAQIETG